MTEPTPDCIFCGTNDHWSVDCPSLETRTPLVLERLPNGEYAWLRPA